MSEETTGRRHPRVSIGLPVFNGGELLKSSIDSLIAQDFRDFEFIISDNASTDSTEDICRDYAAGDSRIKYIRRDRNYGANNNGINAFKQATGDYFMFGSHDDRWHPRFIGECVKVLDGHPHVVLAMPAVQFLSADDGSFCESAYPPLHTMGMGLRSMVAAIFNETNVGYSAYGLYRMDALKKIKMDIDCYGGDVIMLMQMVFQGEVAYIPEKLFYYRLSRKTAKVQMDLVKKEGVGKSTTRPYTSLTINLFRTIMNAEIPGPLKRVILSDALEIIALKNMDWRNAILSENQSIIAFIDQGQRGFSAVPANNLTTLFATLILPYCKKDDAIERNIDFSEIESFAVIPDEHTKPPVPGQKEFMETLTQLAEKNTIEEMLAYYGNYRSFLPDTENLVQIDAMMSRCKR
jgi:glycosyltransferase involved in cell wall biosynthesis